MNNKIRALLNLSYKIEKISYGLTYRNFNKEIKSGYRLIMKNFTFLDHNILEPIIEITVKENWHFEIKFDKDSETFNIELWK